MGKGKNIFGYRMKIMRDEFKDSISYKVQVQLRKI